jgi:hypothetical protein
VAAVIGGEKIPGIKIKETAALALPRILVSIQSMEAKIVSEQ